MRVRVRMGSPVGARVAIGDEREILQPLGRERNAAGWDGRPLFECRPETVQQAAAQSARAVGVDVDAVAGREVEVGWAALEDDGREAGLTEAVCEGETTEAAAGDDDAQGHDGWFNTFPE